MLPHFFLIDGRAAKAFGRTLRAVYALRTPDHGWIDGQLNVGAKKLRCDPQTIVTTVRCCTQNDASQSLQ